MNLRRSIATRMLLVVIALACAGAAFMWQRMDQLEVKQQAATLQVVQDALAPTAAPVSAPTVAEIVNEAPEGSIFSLPELSQFAQWMEDAGYGRETYNTTASGRLLWQPSRDPYGLKTMELEQLRALARSGNMNARMALADRITSAPVRLLKDNLIEEAVKSLTDAAVQGSTSSLNRLSQLQLDLSQARSRVKVASLHVMEAYAYNLVAERRGDLEAPYVREDMEASFPLESAMAGDSAKRAREIYAELAEERSNQGLPPFDNDVPDSVRRTHAAMRAEIMGDVEGLRAVLEKDAAAGRERRAAKPSGG